MKDTKIQWATHSFSPWVGCAKVHAGCQHCYAEAMQNRLGVVWGPEGTRRRTAESTWRQVERWNRKAFCHWSKGSCSDGHIPTCPQHDRPRVFPSLCDPFEDRPDVEPWRRDFFSLIDHCPNLDFLLLTKRPENIRRMWPRRGIRFDAQNRRSEMLDRKNVWLIYSASDQATLDPGWSRHLVGCRSLVPVLGLSLEPILGPIDLGHNLRHWIDWVIVGGESGPRARPCDVAWIRSVVAQCRAAGVPCFVKQLGANAWDGKRPLNGQDCDRKVKAEFAAIVDPKGGDPDEWPADLRVREFPR